MQEYIRFFVCNNLDMTDVLFSENNQWHKVTVTPTELIFFSITVFLKLFYSSYTTTNAITHDSFYPFVVTFNAVDLNSLKNIISSYQLQYNSCKESFPY